MNIFPCGNILDIPEEITSPTPAAVNKAPSAANNCGSILTAPTDWSILSDSSTKTLGFALVIINVTITAITAATPIAADPEIAVNCAIPNAAKAITNDGINTLSPNLFACSSPNFSSKALTVPGLTCLVKVSTAITTNIAPQN